MNQESQTFSSIIGDFGEGPSVFTRTQIHTHWKPVLLISNDLVKFFIYLILYRSQNGDWFVYLRSFSGQSVRKYFKASITLRSPTPKKEVTNLEEGGVVYKWEGDILAHNITESEMMHSGIYLRLSDRQIKTLQRGKTLFEYSVELKFRKFDDPGVVTENEKDILPKQLQ